MKRSHTIAPFLLLFLFGCSAVSVETTYTKDTDFSNYKTFKFLNIQQQFITIQSLTQPQIAVIEDAITKELKMKGMEPADNADLNINIGLKVVEKTQKREQDIRDMHYMGQRNYSWSASDSIVVGNYKEGTLAIELVDPKKDEMVWRGVGKGTVNEKMKMDFDDFEKESVKQCRRSWKNILLKSNLFGALD